MLCLCLFHPCLPTRIGLHFFFDFGAVGNTPTRPQFRQSKYLVGYAMIRFNLNQIQKRCCVAVFLLAHDLIIDLRMSPCHIQCLKCAVSITVSPQMMRQIQIYIGKRGVVSAKVIIRTNRCIQRNRISNNLHCLHCTQVIIVCHNTRNHQMRTNIHCLQNGFTVRNSPAFPIARIDTQKRSAFRKFGALWAILSAFSVAPVFTYS